MLHQLRGNVQESEMRATAAERRVALLQNTLNELQKQQQLDGTIANTDNSDKEEVQKISMETKENYE